MRVSTFGTFRVDWQDAEGIDEDAWLHRTSSRALFLILLCSPQRQIAVSKAIGLLWPNHPEENARASLRTALSTLRKALNGKHKNLLATYEHGNVLALADQSSIWMDADAFEALLEAAHRTETQEEALSLLLQAQSLVQGDFLAHDLTSEWANKSPVKIRRQVLRAARKRMVRQLTDSYLATNQRTRAEEVMQRHLAIFPTDQDVLYRLLTLLVEQACFEEALSLYERSKQCLASLQRQPREHIVALVQAIHLQLKQLAQKPPIFQEKMAPSPHLEQQASQTRLLPAPVMASDPQRDKSKIPSLLISPQMQEEMKTNGGQPMDHQRRRLLQAFGLGMIGAGYSPDQSTLIDPSLLARLTQALAKPSSVDETTLRYLETRTFHYWQDWRADTLAARYLLEYVAEHLQKIVGLLHGSLFPLIRSRVTRLAGETALLCGVLLFELGENEQARGFYTAALQTAEEANQPELAALTWGRISLAWTYENQLEQALAAVQQGRRLIEKGRDIQLSTWLAVVEAEIQAKRQQTQACLRALDDASAIETVTTFSHLNDFNTKKFASYQGVCYQLLYRPEQRETVSYLTEAQTALERALSSLESTYLRERSISHIDLATTYLVQGEIQEACTHALQSATLTQETKSHVILQRLLAFEEKVVPWKEIAEVKQFQECMHLLLPFQIR
jgi:DNA-binding SARP family transcriptional activator